MSQSYSRGRVIGYMVGWARPGLGPLAQLHPEAMTSDLDLYLLQAQFSHMEYRVRSSMYHLRLALEMVYSRCLITVPHYYYNLLSELGFQTLPY